MIHPVELSKQIIDTETISGPTTRITNELSQITPEISLIESFSHVGILECQNELVVIDTSGVFTGQQVVQKLRSTFDKPISVIIYTHGHVDHVGGGSFFKEASLCNDLKVVGHKNILRRFERYTFTNEWNVRINLRQFGDFRNESLTIGGLKEFLPLNTPKPNIIYDNQTELNIGDFTLKINHAMGETDDHSWIYIPELKTIFCGDLFIWLFPNAGNPQKVQRYPKEWTQALRQMLKLKPEIFIPAHGLPIVGFDRINKVLNDCIDALEYLVNEVVSLMNSGKTLNEIIHSVQLDPNLSKKPWLLPLYDEPEFVIRNIWRLYGGWWEGNPAKLKPAKESELAKVLVELVGVEKVIDRALKAKSENNLRLACELIEIAYQAYPDSKEINSKRFEIYDARKNAEPSLMAKGIFGEAAYSSQRIIQEKNS